jgi:hypothetical protein
MRLQKSGLLIIMLILCLLTIIPRNLNAETVETIVILPISLENKKIFRENLVRNMVAKYKNDQTFDKIYQYMLAKASELNKDNPCHSPDFLIEDTFAKTDNLFAKTRFAIKDNPGRFYDPLTFEKSVEKLLWLKGVCFLVMGIKEEHQMAFSYFYAPGNEANRYEFLQEMINYSFPEVPDVPENDNWRRQMNSAMSRLGYRIFSVRKFGIENDGFRLAANDN